MADNEDKVDKAVDTGNANSQTALQDEEPNQHEKNPPTRKDMSSGVKPLEPDAEAQRLKGKGSDWNK